MVYEKALASVWDEWVSERGVPYEEWANTKEKLMLSKGVRPKSMLDLACGTGLSVFPWARRGLKCYGIDYSKYMLEKAMDNAKKKGYKITFLKQDITKLNSDKKVDLITCCFNTVEHIIKKEDLKRMIHKVYEILNKPGAFMFDFNRREWIIYMNGSSETTALSNGSLYLKFEILDKDYNYRYYLRTTINGKEYDQYVYERNYTTNEIKEMLEKTGFRDIKFRDDSGLGISNEKTRSIQVEAWKV